jgi:hypothetical protein
MDDIDTLEIRDESTSTEKRHQLYLNGCQRGLVTQNRSGRIELHWQTHGPATLEESRLWLQGLFELNFIAEMLEQEYKDGKKKSSR